MRLTEIFESLDATVQEERRGSNQRIERILRQLRAQYPAAGNDLEALILNFRNEQRRDRQDINRLDAEIDNEEAEIDQLQAMIDHLRQQRALKERMGIRGLGEKKDRSPGKISKSEDPCWSGYHMVGTKTKNGREVPNCVPGKKGS
jgi:SMC interacting uncharacterized protein involved in chromosome segregation